MTVLLSGGAGFIGSHTAIELVNAGYQVVLADNFSNSSPEVVERMERILGRAIPCYAIDVRDKSALAQVFRDNQVEAVVHFAGFKAVGESIAQPLKYYRNNLDATLTLLELMGEYGTKRFVFSSSATVYGNPGAVPIPETAPAGECSNPYGRTKYMIEQILTDAALADPDLSVVLLRYFNPIGAHQSGLIGERPQGVPNNLMPYITQVAAGVLDRLQVFGGDYPTPDGSGVRDYIHVTDLARGHVAALAYAREHSGAEVFNLGTGRGCSVLELVAAFERANNLTIPYVLAPRRPGDVAACYAQVEKAARVLHWRSESSIEEMCRDSWRWQQNCLKGAKRS